MTYQWKWWSIKILRAGNRDLLKYVGRVQWPQKRPIKAVVTLSPLQTFWAPKLTRTNRNILKCFSGIPGARYGLRQR